MRRRTLSNWASVLPTWRSARRTYVAVHGLEAATRRAAAEVGRARAALEAVGVDDPALHALAEYVIERRW